MNAASTSGLQFIRHETNAKTGLHRSLRNWSMALLISVGSGALSVLAGLAAGAASLLGLTAKHSGLSVLGTLLLIAAFPLLVLAAHCMDKVDETDKAIRLENCRQHGLQDRE